MLEQLAVNDGYEINVSSGAGLNDETAFPGERCKLGIELLGPSIIFFRERRFFFVEGLLAKKLWAIPRARFLPTPASSG